MQIIKSSGVTRTEILLAKLCDNVFLKAWAFPNPFKKDGKELCDVIAVFEDHVFIFFDRESKKFENETGDVDIQWGRWQKEAIEKQVKTAGGAKRYIQEYPEDIFLDSKAINRLPLVIKRSAKIHKIIVAHGAAEACKNYSPDNIFGSLSIVYGATQPAFTPPFMVFLEKNEPVHIFDSFNLEILLSELDTVYDFTSYLKAKEEAIQRLEGLAYCGEEDLLAHYYQNFEESTQQYLIGTRDTKINAVSIGEGEWHAFSKSADYKRRKQANEVSYLWDKLLQRTCQNSLDDIIMGDGNLYTGESAIYEMAKEPRFARRTLSSLISSSVDNFPGSANEFLRNVSLLPSFYKDKAFVFLQIHHPDIKNYEGEYRPRRQALLEIACAAAKNKWPQYKKIIGIAIDAPKFTNTNSEDFLLMDTEEWSSETAAGYVQANEPFKFFQLKPRQKAMIQIVDFPNNRQAFKEIKVGRNDPCPCGSGKKYKKCCFS